MLRLLLASSSPRRADLLRAAGFDFIVRAPIDVDETPRPGEAPADYVVRLAHDKAAAAASDIERDPLWADAPRIVLGADTTVVIDDEILGKPIDDADATRMLRLLAGRTHQVVTGVALHGGGRVTDASAATDVRFGPMSESEIAWYVGTGEPRDKAGAYAIQGGASRFVERIAGSYSNVVGLPISILYQMLQGMDAP